MAESDGLDAEFIVTKQECAWLVTRGGAGVKANFVDGEEIIGRHDTVQDVLDVMRMCVAMSSTRAYFVYWWNGKRWVYIINAAWFHVEDDENLTSLINKCVTRCQLEGSDSLFARSACAVASHVS